MVEPGATQETARGGGLTPEVATEPLLRCEHLVRRYGERTAVDDVSFAIEPGETYGLLGPNGAGKTTTIQMVCGLLRRDGGTVALTGQPVGPRHVRAKAGIGYVPQDLALYPDLTAAENLRFFGRLYGLRGADLSDRVDDVLHLLDLRDRATDRVESFSGGMKRRLNIGAGLLHQPALLMLDEPTAGVDPQSRHAILDHVRGFSASGMGVLYTTHYMEEADRVCDRVGIIDHGRLIAEGTRRELVAMVEERDRIDLVVRGPVAQFLESCRELEGVMGASPNGDGVQLLVEDAASRLPAVLDVAARVGAVITKAQVVEPDLESVFLHLTGTALRD